MDPFKNREKKPWRGDTREVSKDRPGRKEIGVGIRFFTGAIIFADGPEWVRLLGQIGAGKTEKKYYILECAG